MLKLEQPPAVCPMYKEKNVFPKVLANQFAPTLAVYWKLGRLIALCLWDRFWK